MQAIYQKDNGKSSDSASGLLFDDISSEEFSDNKEADATEMNNYWTESLDIILLTTILDPCVKKLRKFNDTEKKGRLLCFVQSIGMLTVGHGQSTVGYGRSKTFDRPTAGLTASLTAV